MDLESILSQLDLREQGGYERRDVELHFMGTEAPESSVSGLMYVATETNPNYLGPAALEQIACQVRSSRGPSGDNVEYVVRLAQSLREMGARDDHVFALEALLLGEVAK